MHTRLLEACSPLLGISVFAVLGGPLNDLLRRRFATFRTIYLPTAGRLAESGFELLSTAQRPHFTVRLCRADDQELGQCSKRSALRSPVPRTLEARPDESRTAVCQVVDLVPAGDGTTVHVRLLLGLVDEYRALVDRALAS
jgi:hypothetical protein